MPISKHNYVKLKKPASKYSCCNNILKNIRLGPFSPILITYFVILFTMFVQHPYCMQEIISRESSKGSIRPIGLMLLHSESQSSCRLWSCYDFSAQVIWIADFSKKHWDVYWKRVLERTISCDQTKFKLWQLLGYYSARTIMQKYCCYVSIHLSHISVWCFCIHFGNYNNISKIPTPTAPLLRPPYPLLHPHGMYKCTTNTR